MGVKILEGRFPENDSEIIVPQMMVAGREELKVGNTITWQIGQRIGSDGRAIDHQTAAVITGHQCGKPSAWQRHHSSTAKQTQFQHNIPHFSIAVLSVPPLLQEV